MESSVLKTWSVWAWVALRRSPLRGLSVVNHMSPRRGGRFVLVSTATGLPLLSTRMTATGGTAMRTAVWVVRVAGPAASDFVLARDVALALPAGAGAARAPWAA